MAPANLRNSLLSLWTKQLSSGCGKAHPASTLANPATRPFVPAALLAKRWSFGAGPGSGKRIQLRRCWMMCVWGDARKGMRARRNVASSCGYSGGYEGHFRAHNGGTQLSTLFDCVVGARILAGHFRVGYEASVGFMVGEYIGSNTGREVDSEVAGEQERVSRSAYWTPLTQLVSYKGVVGSPFDAGRSGNIGTMH